jgi:hypothetical protein
MSFCQLNKLIPSSLLTKTLLIGQTARMFQSTDATIRVSDKMPKSHKLFFLSSPALSEHCRQRRQCHLLFWSSVSFDSMQQQMGFVLIGHDNIWPNVILPNVILSPK